MSFFSLLKKLPIDVGQESMRERTAGKLIAYDVVPKAKKSGLAIDVGCRDFYWSKKLQNKGYTVTSVDLIPAFPGIERGNIEKGLKYKSDTFDVVWCSEVIEHTKKPKKVVDEMLRVCKPGGRVVFTTPNSYFWALRLCYLVGVKKESVQNEDHKQFFSLRSLKKLLPKKGVRIYGYFPYMFVRRKIRRGVGFLSPTFVVVMNK